MINNYNMGKDLNNYELNWNNFKAKYDGREQRAFEQLSYILFCLEHEQNFGIFRYKNQTGIETNTIQISGENIGFQAKFYETSISSNKDDIIDSISKAKNKNPNMNKFFLYVNKELGESSKENKSKPKYQNEIEKAASNKNIELIWRVPSHFERQLTEPEHKWLYETFFMLNKGLVDFVNEIELHSKNNLESIKTEINYNDSVIKLDRTDIIKQLKEQLDSFVPTVIVGKGGCGKTAVIKDIYSTLNCPLFIFKAYEFNNKSNVNELFTPFGQYTFNDFIEIFRDEPIKIMVIDSAEKLADIENTDPFQYFINNLIKNNWKIIFTTRDVYLNDLISLVNGLGCTIPTTLSIPPLRLDELNYVSKNYKFELPDDNKLCELLTIPFYLSEYLNIVNAKDLRLENFKSFLWQKQIMNSKYTKNRIHLRREQTFIELIKQKSLTNSFIIYPKDSDNEALYALCADEIIKYDEIQYGYFITHDIYEEWGLERFIDISYQENTSDYKNFLETIGTSLSVRRSFRNWLSCKLYANSSEILSLIDSLIQDNDVAMFWKDEIIVSIMLSPNANNFFEQYKSQLLENNQALLLRTIFMLRIACKNIDYEFLKMLLIDKDKWLNLKYLMTIPKGKGWKACIQFIFGNIESINKDHLETIIALLQDWINKNKIGDGTKYAGKIALYYLQHFKLYNQNLTNIIKILLNSACEISSEIEDILNEILNGTAENYDYKRLADIILEQPLEVTNAIIRFPDKVFELAKKEWFLKDEKPDNFFGIPTRKEVEECFGLNKNRHSYFPASAFQTPILLLLKTNFEKTLDFIISVINETTEKYAHSELVEQYDNLEQIKIYIDSTNIVEQYCSERLWNAYRGRSVTPYVLQSILMALERVLLEIAEEKDADIIEPILLKLLTNTNSVAITAVVASVVTSQPDKLYNIAKILFKTWELLHQDLQRKIKDQSQFNPAGFNSDKMLREEREKSNKLPHREKSLEDIALYYQLCQNNCPIGINTRRKELSKIWDSWSSNLPEEDNQTEKDINIRYSLARIDYRKLAIKSINKDDKSNQLYVAFKTKEDSSLDRRRNEHKQQYAQKMKYISLVTWANKKFENKTTENSEYDLNPHFAYTKMQEILHEKNPSNDFIIFYHATPAYVAAVLLRDYCSILSLEEQVICKDVLLKYASMPLYLNYNFQYSDGTQPAIETLDCIVKLFPKEVINIQILLVFNLFNWKEIRNYSIKCLSKLWIDDFMVAQQVWLTYLKYKPEYDNFCKKIWKLRYENKEKEIDKEYKKLFTKVERYFKKQHSYKEIDITKSDYNMLNIGFQMLPNASCNLEHLDFCLKTISVFVDIFDKDYNYYEREYREELRQFSTKLAQYLLKLPKDKIDEFLEPLLSKEYLDEDFSEFLQDLSVAQDEENEYEKFWYIWLHCYEKIKQIVNNSKYISKTLIQHYLLAGNIMNCYGKAKSWHSLKQENIEFYYNVANDIGKHLETLHSIAKVFNGIAFNFIKDGIKIIYLLISKYEYKEVDANTIYYIEHIVRNYFLLNKSEIKRNLELKNMLISILTFLVNHGSVFGYMLREQIL